MSDHTVNVGVVVDVKGEEKLDALGKKLAGSNKKLQGTLAQGAAVQSASIKSAVAQQAAATTLADKQRMLVKRGVAEAIAAKSVAPQTSAISFADKQEAIAKRRVAEALAAKAGAPPPTPVSIKQAVGGEADAGKAMAVNQLFKAARAERFEAIGEKIGSSLAGAGSVVKTAVSAIGSELGAFASMASGAAVRLVAFGSAAAAVGAAAVVGTAGLLGFIGAMALMKKSWKWADEAADTQVDTFARMRKNRTNFQAEVSRNMAGTELIGKNFDKLNDKINDKKFAKSDFAKNWDMAGNQLAKFGATQHEAQGAAFGRTRRTDTLDVLERAVTKREELDKRLADAQAKYGKESPQARAAMKKQRQFFDDIADFDEGFAKIASVASKSDIAATIKTTNEIAAMYATPPNASAALGYKRAFMELNAVFDVLKFNIGSAAMPGITTAVKGISESLKSVAPALGRLGGAFVGKGWDVIGQVTQSLAAASGIGGSNLSQTIDGIAKAISEYPKEDISGKLISFGSAIKEVADAVITAAQAVNKARQWLGFQTADERIKSPWKEPTGGIKAGEVKPWLQIPGMKPIYSDIGSGGSLSGKNQAVPVPYTEGSLIAAGTSIGEAAAQSSSKIGSNAGSSFMAAVDAASIGTSIGSAARKMLEGITINVNASGAVSMAGGGPSRGGDNASPSVFQTGAPGFK